MLNTIHIHRYRSCIDVRLTSLGELTVLVGRNGAGKTNILRAIEWVARLASSFPSTHEYQTLTSESGFVTFEFELSGRKFTYRILRETRRKLVGNKPTAEQIFEEDISEEVNGVDIHLLRRRGDLVELLVENRELKVSGSSAIIGLVSVLPTDDEFRQLMLDFVVYFSKIIYFPVENFRPNASGDTIIDDADIKKWEADLYSELDVSGNATVMRLLGKYRDDRETFEELKKLLGEDGLQLISDIEVIELSPEQNLSDEPGPREKNPYYFMRFRPHGHSRSFSFRNLSFGTQRIIRLVTYIVANRVEFLMIEQPEDGIHPALLHKLIPLFRSYIDDSQMIIASHAPAIMNRLSPGEIRLVEIVDGRTHLRALSPDEVHVANEYLESEGPLSDFIESL